MNKQTLSGNCYPNERYAVPYNPCKLNQIARNNQIYNSFHSIPREYDVREDFNVCDSQTIIQPKLNVGTPCRAKNHPLNRMSWREWANLTPVQKDERMGGYVRLVHETRKNRKNQYESEVIPMMGKIDIPNYFMPLPKYGEKNHNE